MNEDEIIAEFLAQEDAGLPGSQSRANSIESRLAAIERWLVGQGYTRSGGTWHKPERPRPGTSSSIGFCSCGATIIIGGPTIHRPGCQMNARGAHLGPPPFMPGPL